MTIPALQLVRSSLLLGQALSTQRACADINADRGGVDAFWPFARLHSRHKAACDEQVSAASMCRLHLSLDRVLAAVVDEAQKKQTRYVAFALFLVILATQVSVYQCA